MLADRNLGHLAPRRASPARNLRTTGREWMPRHQAGVERCCAASSRAPRGVTRRGPRPSTLAQSHELFQPAFQPRQLFTRAEAAPPFRPLLETVLVLARARLLFARPHFGRVIEGPLRLDPALPLLVVVFAVRPRHVNGIDHEPLADACMRLVRKPPHE